MKIYGLTTSGGQTHVFNSSSARSLVARTTKGSITEWEHDVPDEVTRGEVPLPTTYGAMITAMIKEYDLPVVLVRIGKDEHYPWVGYSEERGEADSWAPRGIESWEPFHTAPSAEALAEYLFQVQGWVLEEQEAKDLAAFISDEMVR